MFEPPLGILSAAKFKMETSVGNRGTTSVPDGHFRTCAREGGLCPGQMSSFFGMCASALYVSQSVINRVSSDSPSGEGLSILTPCLLRVAGAFDYRGCA